MSSLFLTTRSAAYTVVALLLAGSGLLPAQSIDRLELHGALNAGYGRAQELPVFGIPVTGTSDYRTLTLQGRYTLNDNDQIVAQVFNRRLGSSPLAGAISDVTMQWAYWQHRAGSLTFKAGRNPLPRGLSNETRYIGTVHPFFRPPTELQQDAFDAIDGAVVSYRHDVGAGLELEQFAFGGGSENRAIATTTTGQEVRVARTENMFGGQTYLRFPVANARIGVYGARYNFNQATTKGYRTQTMLSAEATPVDRLKLEAEHMHITGHGPNNDNRSGYVQATVRVAERFALGGQHAYTTRMLYFANTDLNELLPEVRTNGVSGIITLSPNAVLKLEQHWRDGWSFDTATPPVASQTATSFVLSDARHSRYYLISLAASF